MFEHVERRYYKEEEFLNDFAACVAVVQTLLADEWRPDWQCNDDVRSNRKSALKQMHCPNWCSLKQGYFTRGRGSSSIQIDLSLLIHHITVWIKPVGSDWTAEKIADTPALRAE